MIGRALRFHGYGSLNYVYKQGKSVRGEHMALRYAGNTRRKSSRVAVVVSKKVSKSAVKRNRIRRRVYEVIRQYLPAIDQPHDIIFTIFDEQVAELSHPELTKLVGSQLKKAGII